MIALIVLVAGQAQAASIFGKYQGVSGKCAEFDRVYVSIKDSSAGPRGVKSIWIQYYNNNDATMDEVLLGEGSRQAPGTSPGIHGKVTQTWKTTQSENAIISTSITTSRSGSYTERTEIVRKGDKLVITIGAQDAANQPFRSERCVLQR